MSYALFSAGLDVRAAKTIAEIKDTIADFVRLNKAAIVLGFGASAHCVTEKRLLTRADIDEVCRDRPVYIVKYDGHPAVANSALLAMLEGGMKVLRGFKADSWLMTQEALDLYTRNAAFIGFDDKVRGGLEAGKVADMVVLKRSSLASSPRNFARYRWRGSS